jgi:hypothetical protein
LRRRSKMMSRAGGAWMSGMSFRCAKEMLIVLSYKDACIWIQNTRTYYFQAGYL